MTPGLKNTGEIDDLVQTLRPEYERLSDAVWGTPETCYGERKSAAAHAGQLRAAGFRVSEGVAGIPTALIGEAGGEDGPLIAFLGEYDALPGLSQKEGMNTHDPLEAQGNGHGCGHNLLGAAAMLAAASVKRWLEENDLPGRVRYYGCPAEEGGGAKAFMVREGLFDDVDIAISWHPENFCEVLKANSLANTRVDFLFHGRSSHAAMAPHLGRSALDAVELTSVGCNYLREHIPPDCRLHYAVLDSGGIAPNVVQNFARVRYSVRASDNAAMRDLYARVCDVARGAALMTGTTLEIRPISAVSNLLANTPLETAMWEELESLGPPDFNDDDIAFATRMRESISEEDITYTHRRFGLEPDPDRALCDFVVPRDAPRMKMFGSTDLGDVSWVVPLVQMQGATCAIGTPFHSWQLVAQGKSDMAKKGMVHAATVMARTAIRALRDPALINAAKADLRHRVGADGYVSPLPEGIDPPIREMAPTA
ncbi:M20 family metallopeptidase [Paracoccus sp. (in: a-proteobacteria)]|uniref:M20 family metallopeptidase n=1 Tax=Paracoccus sp. TaxID=267 RepID=UPI003A89F088